MIDCLIFPPRTSGTKQGASVHPESVLKAPGCFARSRLKWVINIRQMCPSFFS